MNQQCTQPACIFNCCNEQGLCPTSIRECAIKRNSDPLTLQIAVCVIVAIVIVALVLVLKYKQRKTKKQLTTKESFITQASVKNDVQKNIQIQMGLQNQFNQPQQRAITLEIPVIEITPYRRTNQVKSELNKRISDIFSTSRQSKISEQVEIFFSRRFSRILDDNQQ